MTVLLPKHTGMTTSTDGTPDVVPVDVRDTPPWQKARMATTVDANTALETAVAGTHAIWEVVTGIMPIGTLLIADIEPIGRDWILLRMEAATNCGSFFNITTGAVGTATNATRQITPISGFAGRYRCEAKITTSVTSPSLLIYASTDGATVSYVGDAAKGIKIFDLQTSWVIDEITLSDGFFGKLTFEVSGEKAGDPTKTYTYKCDAIYSCDSGVATLRAQGTTQILDPDAYSWAITLDTDGAKARCRVTGKDGENWIWSGQITGLTRSRLPAGTTSFIDASINSSVTADFIYTGTNVVVDGDMEAVGTAAWTPSGAPTLSKESAAPRAGQCLRITKVGSSGIAFQLVVAANTRWNASVWQRTDGTVGANSAETVGAVLATDTGSTWTQIVQNNVLAGNAGYDLYKYSNPGNYSEFDDATCVRLPIVSAVSDRVIGGPGIAQATAANRPTYIDSGDYFLFDGTSQWFDTNFVPTPEFTVGVWWYVDTIAAGTVCIIGSYSGALAQMLRIGSLLQIYVGSNALNHPTPLTVGWHHLVFGRAGATQTVWLDGVPASAGTALDPSTRKLYVGARNNAGVADTFASGRMGNLFTATRLFADAEILDLYNATYRT